MGRDFALAVFSLAFFSSAILYPNAGYGRAPSQDKIVTVYSYRQPFLIEPLFREFEKKTGIVVNVLFAKKGLIERIALEGRLSPADLLLTTDIGQLFQASQSISYKVKSPILEKNIPAKYRDSQGRWFALTKRVRAIFVAIDENEFNGIAYEDLASPELGGAICMRDAQHPYNIALIASFIAHHGVNETRAWLRGLKANLARRPSGNDRLQIKGVYSGECQIAIANTYYMGHLLTNEKNPDQMEWARGVKILFPRFEEGGTHLNFSGMVLTRFAPNRDYAIQLMEYLSSAEAQKIYASQNFEYPISPYVSPSSLVRGWGRVREDDLALEEIVSHRGEASLLVDETALND